MQYFSQITGVKETDKGTDLLLHIPKEKVQGRIMKYRNNNVINAELRIDDNRTITVDQRKKIFATIRDIADYTGDHPEDMRAWLLYDYCIKTGEMPFSLSNCSIAIAREYITFIIDFILREDIPLSDKALERTEDIDRYLYGCIKYKKCCICGRGGETHHALDDKIGMGNNRKKVNHIGRKAVCLCRTHHTELHSMSEQDFYYKYHIYPIKLDEHLVSILNL